MPISWLQGLTAAARSAYPFVRRGVRESLSLERIRDSFRNSGVRIANASLREMVRREREIRDYIGNFLSLRPTSLPDPRALPEALTTLKKRYSIEVAVSGIHTQTGQPITRNISISSDSLLSAADIGRTVSDVSGRKGDRYGFDLIGYEVVGYMRAGPEGTV